MVFDFLRRGTNVDVPEVKASATGPVVSHQTSGRVAWSPRDVVSLTRTGFSSNPVGFRSVKLIAEAAAALPLILQDWERRYDVHPLLDLVTRPNAGHGRAKLMEELFQFRDAELVSAGTFALSHRLRGQLGSDALMPGIWPAGSWFVLLNGVPSQINMAENLRHIEQNFQIGPAVRPNNDPSYVAQSHVFEGVGLRPYAPVHLRKSGTPDHEFNWIRRTRLDGDDWTLPDVPLNEETESYRVQVKVGGDVIREAFVSDVMWSYTGGMRTADGVVGLYSFEVAQVSARFGVGLAAQTIVAA